LINALLEEKKSRFERDFFLELERSSLKSLPPKLREACLYSLSGKNKRFRPILALEAAALSNLAYERALKIAASIECLHTYSLVHDDLPAMDNDDIRRGQPTSHKKYNEATAILVGDLLQSVSFELLASAALPAVAIRYFARAVGGQGMVAGQYLDMNATNINTLRLHQLKTGKLIETCFVLPGLAVSGKIARHKMRWGRQLGLLFQLTDDLLDRTADTQTLGKTAGKDVAQNKKTLVATLGFEAAQTMARDLAESLSQRAPSDFFAALPTYLIERRA